MFSTFKIFVIYLIIPSSCANILPPNGEKTTLSSMEQVKKELAPIEENLKMIVDSQTSNDKKLDLKREVRGSVKKIIERAVKVDRLLVDLGAMGKEKDNTDMYQLFFALTFRVDTLEKLLALGEEFAGQQRSKRWMYIFTKNTPAVENLRNKVYAAGMTEVSFAEQVERLIQERNSLAGHVNIPLPSLIKEKTIKGALEIMDITEDDKAVETLKILVAPVKGLDLTITQKS